MKYYVLLMILGSPDRGNSFWPASYRVDLSDRKTYVITAGEDKNEDDEENENEMIRPEDLAGVVDLAKYEERYKPLHSYVKHYNRRAAEAAKQYPLLIPSPQINTREINVSPEKPFIAGFKHELDKHRGPRDRPKRQEDGNNQSSGEDADVSSTTVRIEEYDDNASRISEDPENSSDRTKSSTKEFSKKATNIFVESDVTPAKEFEENTEEVYDYENLRAEYDQQLVDAKSSNSSFNNTDNEEPEEEPKDAIKKIIEFDKPKNCTEEELTKFGAKAFACLAFDYRAAKNRTEIRKIFARTWNVMKVWICIYVCIAVPAWCQKGWCCCCFRCGMCFPRKRIYIAKKYYADNEPGILVEQPFKKGAKPETIMYKPTLFEIDAYEKFGSAIRNL